MNPRPLRVDQALDLLPDVDDLLPLRDALIGGSRADGERAWAASEAYLTVDTRLADPAALEAELPAVLARVQQRTEAVYRAVVAALRAAEAGDQAGAARALVQAGETEEAAGRLDAAERFFDRAAQLGRRPRDRRVEGLALRRLGRVARARGELDRSLALYRKGYEVAEAQRDAEGMLVACQGLGNVTAEQGRWEEAERWYRRGLELLAGSPPSRPLWQLQSNLSAVALQAGRMEEGAQWLERARSTVNALGDDAGRVYVLNAEGVLRVARGEPAGAAEVLQEALRLGSTPAERARVMVNLAEALLLAGRVPESEGVLRELERLAVTHRLIPSLPYAYRGLGAVARARGDEEGFLFFEQALELCRETGLPAFELALTQREYAAWEADRGLLESAAARLREARDIFAGLGTLSELETTTAELARLGEGIPDPGPAAP